MSRFPRFHFNPFFHFGILLGLVVGFFAFYSSNVFANEIWVLPTNKTADSSTGNWAVTNLGGATHFGFAIPDNMDVTADPPQASIVVVPNISGDIDYDLTLTVGQNGDPHDSPTLTVPLSGLMLFGAVKDQLTEIDVSSIFNGVPLVPGATYVSLSFETGGTGRKVVGMRF